MSSNATARAGAVNAPATAAERWADYVERYRSWEWRAFIFRDMILEDAARLGANGGPVMLDIGCGRGFDDDEPLQAAIAARAAQYIGVEPDPDIGLAPVFTAVHRAALEDAPIPPASVDLAFSVMVLEHLRDPLPFWAKLHEVLRPGGVFWGFTVDARHWFATVSRLAGRLRITDWYLERMHGRAGEDRHHNYPTFYRSNSPRAIRRHAAAFSSCDVLSLARVGQVDPYLPRSLRPVSRFMDRIAMRLQLPGTNLVVRAVK